MSVASCGRSVCRVEGLVPPATLRARLPCALRSRLDLGPRAHGSQWHLQGSGIDRSQSQMPSQGRSPRATRRRLCRQISAVGPSPESKRPPGSRRARLPRRDQVRCNRSTGPIDPPALPSAGNGMEAAENARARTSGVNEAVLGHPSLDAHFPSSWGLAFSEEFTQTLLVFRSLPCATPSSHCRW